MKHQMMEITIQYMDLENPSIILTENLVVKGISRAYSYGRHKYGNRLLGIIFNKFIENKYVLKCANGTNYFAGYNRIYEGPVYDKIQMAQKYSFEEVNEVKNRLEQVFNHKTIIERFNS